MTLILKLAGVLVLLVALYEISLRRQMRREDAEWAKFLNPEQK